MIPQLVAVRRSPWLLLPPGIHDATVAEVETAYATTPHRRQLFEGFSRMHRHLWSVGCREIWLDGSFVTSKPHPDDFDLIWNERGVDLNRLDPVLLDYDNKREAQKNKYRGEAFISYLPAVPGQIYLEFFQRDKESGKPKGILRVSP